MTRHFLTINSVFASPLMANKDPDYTIIISKYTRNYHFMKNVYAETTMYFGTGVEKHDSEMIV